MLRHFILQAVASVVLQLGTAPWIVMIDGVCRKRTVNTLLLYRYYHNWSLQQLSTTYRCKLGNCRQSEYRTCLEHFSMSACLLPAESTESLSLHGQHICLQDRMLPKARQYNLYQAVNLTDGVKKLHICVKRAEEQYEIPKSSVHDHGSGGIYKKSRKTTCIHC
jgi:hypothetical protein